jgi:hypothetical protein
VSIACVLCALIAGSLASLGMTNRAIDAVALQR